VNYQQAPPFAVQIELVEGCNLMCGFCGINGIRSKAGQYKFMDMGVVTRIARDVAGAGWSSHILLAMHGEPSLHPRLVECITALRVALPKNDITLVSNGSGFNRATWAAYDTNCTASLGGVMSVTAKVNGIVYNRLRGFRATEKLTLASTVHTETLTTTLEELRTEYGRRTAYEVEVLRRAQEGR